MAEIDIREFLDDSGTPRSRAGLNAIAAARQGVTIAAAQRAWIEYKRGRGAKEHGEWH